MIEMLPRMLQKKVYANVEVQCGRCKFRDGERGSHHIFTAVHVDIHYAVYSLQNDEKEVRHLNE